MAAIVNIFICIVIPLLLLLVVMDRKTRAPIFFLIMGMLAALLSVYFNACSANLYDYNNLQVGLYVAPLNEEIIKVIPLVLYVIFKKPNLKKIITAAVAIGVGFATIENIVYLMTYGISNFTFILIRGFSTGIMHSITLCIFGLFLYRIKRLNIIKDIFVFVGVFSFASAFHGLFNLLVNADLPVAIICGYFLPPVVAIGFIVFQQWKYITEFFNKIRLRNKAT